MTLLPPVASELERTIELVMARRLNSIPLLHRTLTSPDKCPAHLLNLLAWAVSVDVWRDSWPTATKRAVIKAALQIHRTKGTVTAVRNAVEAFGSEIDITEWFEETPPAEPSTFRVTFTPGDSLPNTAQFQQDVNAAIEQTKPLHAHHTLAVQIPISSPLNTVGVARAALYVRLTLAENP